MKRVYVKHTGRRVRIVLFTLLLLCMSLWIPRRSTVCSAFETPPFSDRQWVIIDERFQVCLPESFADMEISEEEEEKGILRKSASARGDFMFSAARTDHETGPDEIETFLKEKGYKETGRRDIAAGEAVMAAEFEAEYEGKKILALCVPCEGQLYFFAAGPCAEENEDLCEEILNSVSLIWDERQDP